MSWQIYEEMKGAKIREAGKGIFGWGAREAGKGGRKGVRGDREG